MFSIDINKSILESKVFQVKSVLQELDKRPSVAIKTVTCNC